MWHRRHARDGQDRSATDPVATMIWQEGHVTGEATTAPVIKAPRAGDLTSSDAA